MDFHLEPSMVLFLWKKVYVINIGPFVDEYDMTIDIHWSIPFFRMSSSLPRGNREYVRFLLERFAKFWCQIFSAVSKLQIFNGIPNCANFPPKVSKKMVAKFLQTKISNFRRFLPVKSLFLWNFSIKIVSFAFQIRESEFLILNAFPKPLLDRDFFSERVCFG